MIRDRRTEGKKKLKALTLPSVERPPYVASQVNSPAAKEQIFHERFSVTRQARRGGTRGRKVAIKASEFLATSEIDSPGKEIGSAQKTDRRDMRLHLHSATLRCNVG